MLKDKISIDPLLDIFIKKLTKDLFPSCDTLIKMLEQGHFS